MNPADLDLHCCQMRVENYEKVMQIRHLFGQIRHTLNIICHTLSSIEIGSAVAQW